MAIARTINPEVATTKPEAASISQSKQQRGALKAATTMMRCTRPVKMADNIRSESSTTVAATGGDVADTETMSTEVVIEVTTAEALVATRMRAMATPLISSPKPPESTNQRRKTTAKSLRTTRSS